MGRSVIAFAAALAAVGIGSAAQAGTSPPPGACPTILAPKPARMVPFTVAGQTVQLRDPYGGQVSRNRLFVAFGLRYPTAAARAAVGSVQWLVDGAPPARNASGRKDQLSFQSTRLTAGQHVIAAVVTPAAGGPPVQAQITVQATDCQPASVFPDVVNGKTVQPVTLAISGGGPPLDSVTVSASGLRASVPSSLAGRKVGTLRLRSVDGPDLDDTLRSYTLRAPTRLSGTSVTLLRRGSLVVKLRRAGSGRLLSITGLPSIAQGITITTARGVISVAKACPVPSITARLTAESGSPVAVETGIEISRNC
jgi:hypothetical protein